MALSPLSIKASEKVVAKLKLKNFDEKMEEKGQIASIFEPNTWTLTYQVAKLKVKTLTKERTSQNLLWPVSIGSIGFMLKLHKLRLTEMQLSGQERKKRPLLQSSNLRTFGNGKRDRPEITLTCPNPLGF